MKKLILSFVFIVSMGATLFVTTSSITGNSYEEKLPHYQMCKDYIMYNSIPPRHHEYSEENLFPCPYNAAFFYDFEGTWEMYACPMGLFFCTEKRACTYFDDPDCSWSDTQRCL